LIVPESMFLKSVLSIIILKNQQSSEAYFRMICMAVKNYVTLQLNFCFKPLGLKRIDRVFL